MNAIGREPNAERRRIHRSCRQTAWISARRSIGRASKPATAIIERYWPANHSARTSGLAVASMRPPTLPVTQTAAFVTQDVTPRITKSPAACAALPARSPAALQTKSTPGRSQGFGIDAAEAGAAAGPAARSAISAVARVAAATRNERLRHRTRELPKARDRREQVALSRCSGRGRKWRRGTWGARKRRDLPCSAFPDKRHRLGSPGLLGRHG